MSKHIVQIKLLQPAKFNKIRNVDNEASMKEFNIIEQYRGPNNEN